MKDTTVKMWLSLCSEALLYLLDETDVFYHMPALSEDFSILRNMQPFCNLNQGKESEWKKKKKGKLSSPRDLSTSKGTAGSEANLNLNSLTCFLLQKQMFLWL